MPFVKTKVKNSEDTKPHALSNVQMELIKLYSTNLDYDDLVELKNLLINHFSRKAIDEADGIWSQKKMSAQTMDSWLNEK